MTEQFTWTGEKFRCLRLARPCDCGCDRRDGSAGAGYLTGSDEEGEGFTIWIKDNAVFERLDVALQMFEEVIEQRLKEARS